MLDETSEERIRLLSEDLVGEAWDLVMLESGQATATGQWRNVGEVAATCAFRWHTSQALLMQTESVYSYYYHRYLSNETDMCTWQGSRGYLISHRGAQTLLKFAQPMMVQVRYAFIL